MTDFVEYIVSEMKSRRLSKDRASALIAQFHARPAAAGQGGFLHPMLHRNTSDLSEQRFSARFDGQEPFLRDHQVQGQKVLPGVAYLEMVRAAIEQAVPDVPQASIVELRDVMWVQPSART
jgi:polyketide synthase PksL